MSPLSWRATFWFCFAFALAIMSALILFFPETYRINAKFDLELPTTINTEADNITSVNSSSISSATLEQVPNSPEKESNVQEEKVVTIEENVNPDTTKRRMNPIGAFLLLRHPFILLSAFISGIAFGCMFAVETIIPDLYESHYGFNSWKTGTIILII